jgi:NADPH2:quinone reductase
MKAIAYTAAGGPDVLTLTDRPIPEPGPGEVRVRVHVSGVNPTDWKARRSATPSVEAVPNQDGAGVVDVVGDGVPTDRVGRRVWIWEAAWQRPDGTAQEYVVLPQRQAVPLPDDLPADTAFDLGASVGIPAMTAHRCLTVGWDAPDRLAPGALADHTVLVAGGAGAVGNAAIQLAKWAGATVVTTVSSPYKEGLAKAAGADHVVNYREGDTAETIRRAAPDGVDIVVEVAPAVNAATDLAVLAPNGVVAFYANDGGGDEVALPVRRLMFPNIRYQGILVYTVPDTAKLHAVEDVSAAIAAGALRVGADAGLPLHRYPLERTGDAHTAVENGAVGKVLVDIATEGPTIESTVP